MGPIAMEEQIMRTVQRALAFPERLAVPRDGDHAVVEEDDTDVLAEDGRDVDAFAA